MKLKKKRGQPAKLESERKSINMGFKVTKEEYSTIMAKANLAGIPVAQHLRNAALSK